MSENQTSATEPTVQLQLSDLVLTLNIIQLASSRGAFKPEEFMTIGTCYDRISSFLQANGVNNQPQPTTEQTENKE